MAETVAEPVHCAKQFNEVVAGPVTHHREPTAAPDWLYGWMNLNQYRLPAVTAKLIPVTEAIVNTAVFAVSAVENVVCIDGVDHASPVPAVESAAKRCPFTPTARVAGVDTPDPAVIAPFAVYNDFGVAASAVVPCAAVAYAVEAVVAAVPNPNVVRVVAASAPVRSDLPYPVVANAAIEVKSASNG